MEEKTLKCYECKECPECFLENKQEYNFSLLQKEGEIIIMEKEKVFRCSECWKEFTLDEMRENTGEQYCEDCFNDLFEICSDCSNYFPTDSMFWIEEGEYHVCNYCYDDNDYFRCDHCGVHFPDRDRGRENYCKDCFSENYFCCDRCNEIYHLDNSYNNDNGIFCEECFEEEEEINNEIHRNDYKPPWTFFPQDLSYKRGERFFGLEIEFSNEKNFDLSGILDNNSEFCFFKKDSSISGNYTAELVTHPATLNYLQKDSPLVNILENLNNQNCTSFKNSTCGFHIHTSNHFSTIQKIKLSLLLYSNFSKFECFCQRHGNNYAKAKYPKLSREMGHSEERYEALNFTNRNTVEFRLPKGTLKFQTIIAIVEMFDAMIEFSKKTNLNCKQIATEGLNDFYKFACKAEKYLYLNEYLQKKLLKTRV